VNSFGAQIFYVLAHRKTFVGGKYINTTPKKVVVSPHNKGFILLLAEK